MQIPQELIDQYDKKQKENCWLCWDMVKACAPHRSVVWVAWGRGTSVLAGKDMESGQAAHTPEPAYTRVPILKHLQKASKVISSSTHHWATHTCPCMSVTQKQSVFAFSQAVPVFTLIWASATKRRDVNVQNSHCQKNTLPIF